MAPYRPAGDAPQQGEERAELLPAGGGVRHGVLAAPALGEHPPRGPDPELPRHPGGAGGAHQTGGGPPGALWGAHGSVQWG